MRRVPDGVAIGLWVTGVRVDFVASKDNRALILSEEMSEKRGEIKTDHME